MDRRSALRRPHACLAAAPALLAFDGVSDGVWQAVALVGASELGDKTFFLSAIIAMKEGRAIAFTGSMAALTALTGVSVGLGQAAHHVPDLLATGLPVGDLLATSMFTYFGLQMLREGQVLSRAGGLNDMEAQRDAEEAIAEREAKSRPEGRRWWAAIAAAFSLVFVAEVGDKSMFATIALAREFNPWGVFAGALIGHSLATGLAVISGSALSSYVSQATVSYLGGGLFLVFAAVTGGSILSGGSSE